MSAPYLLGVDLGTGGPKVALTTARGELLGHEAEHVDLRLLPRGGVEQDPAAWWAAIVVAATRLLGRGLVPVEKVAAICVSSQWGGLVAVDAQGRHLRPAQTWMDSRGAAYSQALTGGRLPVPEYLTMRLTGRAVAGWDTALLRWATDNRDPSDVRWDDALLRRIGWDRDRLPELVRPASVVGTLLPEVAAELGLPASVQVVTGTSDTTAAAVGAGAVADYSGHLYIGTSAWLSCHVPFKRTDVMRNVASLPAAVPDRYWVATVQDVAGKAIDWLIHQVVYPDDDMLDSHPVPDDALERLNVLALTAPPGSNGVVFTPWLNGERTPVDDPTLRGGWFNVSLATDRADLARSVFEGIALNVRWMKEAVEIFLAKEKVPELTDLAFIGGGAQSALWCQTLADVLGCTIRQVAEPVLANARGAALYAGVGIGVVTWDEIPSLVTIADTFHPDPKRRAVYDQQYRTFTQLYRRTRRLYAVHNRRPGVT